MDEQPQLYVDIIDDEGDIVVLRMGPSPKSEARQVARGAAINLNHSRYFIRIVPVAEAGPA